MMTAATQIGFMKALCNGDIEEELILPYPKVEAEERETLKGVQESLRALLAPRSEEFTKWDVEGEMPPEFIQELREFGLFGLVIPEEYGGFGLSATGYSRTLQEIAKYDASVAVTVGAHSSIGMRGLILFGNDEQKSRYLGKLSSGEMIAAFCLTEPSSGSDAASVMTTAKRDGDDFVLNGSKLWITNGGIAQFFTVFAKLDDGKGKLSAFIVTSDMLGVSVGTHEDKMGLRASSTTTVDLENVRVPKSNLLGEEGKGFKIAMSILNSGRTGLGGGCVGAMKQLIALATRQANERKQFGKSIAEFGLVQKKIGTMVLDCYASESIVNMVAGLVDSGHEEYAVEAAISKIYASEALWRVVDEALQISGGNGFMREYPYERLMRDSRINRIFEGTNEILRLFVALTGMSDVGSQLKELSSSLQGAFKDPIKGFGVLSEYAIRRASWATGLKRDKGAFTKLHPLLKEATVSFELATRELAAAVDRVLRKHGRKIIEKQLATERIADMMIELFALACVLSRVDQSLRASGSQSCEHEILIAESLGRRVRRRVRHIAEQIDQNEDEQLKTLAAHACDVERFAWDNI